MTISDHGLALTKSFEGLRLTAYRDSAGILTIGYGHTGPDVRAGQTITETEADGLLRQDMAAAQACVNANVTVPLTQPQFDALCDFTFNAGRGSFKRSTLLRKLNAGDYVGAAEEFAAWVYAGGVKVEGLVARRKAEADLFRGNA